jgi:hypothetical protein
LIDLRGKRGDPHGNEEGGRIFPETANADMMKNILDNGSDKETIFKFEYILFRLIS